MNNAIQNILCSLGISDFTSLEPFFPKVRDRDDISVIKCRKSGVLFLSRSDHISTQDYEERDSFQYWGKNDREKALNETSDDDTRRYREFKNSINNKKWIDIGTGVGGILDLLSPIASETSAVEPQRGPREELKKLGYQIYSRIEEAPKNHFDIVTLFHVLEHFTDPIRQLQLVRETLNDDGEIIIEVPHANDVLISLFNLESFKAFTFWSEHLILHTKESLRIFLENSGFRDISINGFQRYPLENHLHWLAKGEPGGHKNWPQLRSDELDEAYSRMLSNLNLTDTLIALARK